MVGLKIRFKEIYKDNGNNNSMEETVVVGPKGRASLRPRPELCGVEPVHDGPAEGGRHHEALREVRPSV